MPGDLLTHHLETMLGAGATFRVGQREAIEAITQDRSRALVVQRTGWGKSLVYWIATRVRRDAGSGPTLIVSPLLSLMRNQIAMAGRLGLRAETINSSNREDWAAVERGLESDAIDVLLISPERLANEDFVTRVLPAIQRSIGLLVIDEAHCISDWGHDFRPDYRRISRILRLLPPAVPVLATTATANDRVVADVAEQMGAGVSVLRGPLGRDTLRLQAIRLADQAERLAWLAEQLPGLPGTGIVYCLTVADVERVAAWLSSHGLRVRAYHGQLDGPEQELLEAELLDGSLKALVSTVALGMGFDKPDLGFVVHYQRPPSVIAYYQQVGRAGRAVERAYGICLSGREDDDIAEYFIRTAFPPTVHMHAALDALAERTTMSIRDLEAAVNLPQGQLEKALKLLELDGAVARERGRWFRTANPWQPDDERMARVIETRLAELDEMRTYVAHDGCLMEYLERALDDPTAAPCGRCANERGSGLPTDVRPDLVEDAIRFLRRDARPIEPRKQWPVTSDSGSARRITPPNEPGVALCVHGDAGWGGAVARGKDESGHFGDDLVAASLALIRERWRPSPGPEWVTSVPSAGARSPVGDFATRLAAGLGIPYVDCLTARVGLPPQKEMLNSVLQHRNAANKIGIRPELVRPGLVLLVDDIVDSGWTLTVAGSLLRDGGAGSVYPFALAVASARGA